VEALVNEWESRKGAWAVADSGEEAGTQLLGLLAQQPDSAGWKVRQADHALRILFQEIVRTAWAPPVVLTRAEVTRLFECLSGENRLMARLLYGSGLRLQECVRWWVKDVDVERRQIVVRDGKGAKWVCAARWMANWVTTIMSPKKSRA
jgi:integrase